MSVRMSQRLMGSGCIALRPNILQVNLSFPVRSEHSSPVTPVDLAPEYGVVLCPHLAILLGEPTGQHTVAPHGLRRALAYSATLPSCGRVLSARFLQRAPCTTALEVLCSRLLHVYPWLLQVLPV